MVINALQERVQPSKSSSINHQKAFVAACFPALSIGNIAPSEVSKLCEGQYIPNIQQVKAKETISVRCVPFMLQNVWMV